MKLIAIALAGCLTASTLGCPVPYTCDEPPLERLPRGGIDPNMPAICRGRCDPARCPARTHYVEPSCDCIDDPPTPQASAPSSPPAQLPLLVHVKPADLERLALGIERGAAAAEKLVALGERIVTVLEALAKLNLTSVPVKPASKQAA